MVVINRQLDSVKGRKLVEVLCSCNKIYSMRKDAFIYNKKHGKGNGCCRKCKKDNAISYTAHEPSPTVVRSIYSKDVEAGLWDDTMFGDDFYRFFRENSNSTSTIYYSLESLKESLKEGWLEDFRNTTDKVVDFHRYNRIMVREAEIK